MLFDFIGHIVNQYIYLRLVGVNALFLRLNMNDTLLGSSDFDFVMYDILYALKL